MLCCGRKKTKIVIEKRKIQVLLCKMTKTDKWLVRLIYRKKTNINQKITYIYADLMWSCTKMYEYHHMKTKYVLSNETNFAKGVDWLLTPEKKYALIYV